MKNLTILALFQALSSVISSILISNMSFVGRIGISTAYRQYLIFKTWWKTALVLLVVQLIIILILFIARKINLKIGKFVAFLLFIVGIIGAYFTYIDFSTTNHKMMKMEFHSGFYLFWASWLISGLYFLLLRKPKIIDNESATINKTDFHHENFIQNEN